MAGNYGVFMFLLGDGQSRLARTGMVVVVSGTSAALGCNKPPRESPARDSVAAATVAADCAAPAPEVWVERRFPAARRTDGSPATLSIALAPGLDSAPPRTMISVVVAGPERAEQPDTVRLLASEAPDHAPLWQGTRRPGMYSANLTMQGYRAGPHRFALDPGERVEVEVAMGSHTDCRAPAGSTPPGAPRP